MTLFDTDGPDVTFDGLPEEAYYDHPYIVENADGDDYCFADSADSARSAARFALTEREAEGPLYVRRTTEPRTPTSHWEEARLDETGRHVVFFYFTAGRVT